MRSGSRSCSRRRLYGAISVSYKHLDVYKTQVQDSGGGVCLGLHDADNGQLLAVGHQLLHVSFIIQLAQPDIVLSVVDIAVGLVDKLEGHAQKIVIGIGSVVRGQVDLLVLRILL